MRRLTAGLLGLALVLGGPSLAAGAEENHYIAVIGSGKAEQWPDYAVVTARISAVEKSTKEAVTKTSTMLRTLADSLRKRGIPDEQVEFLEPSVVENTERVQEKDGVYRSISTGFVSSQGLKVRVNDLDRIGEIITILTDGGAEISSGVSFEIKDPGELQARARARAIANAREKAQDFAAGSKRRLGRLLIVEESFIGSHRLFPNLRELITGSRRRGLYRDESSEYRPNYVYLTPQAVSVTVTLYVKFALQ